MIQQNRVGNAVIRYRPLLTIVLLICSAGSSPRLVAQFYAAELRALSRSGGQVSTTFDLSVTSGDRLDEIDTLFFSHPGIAATLKTLDPLPYSEDRRAHYGQFTVTVADDVPPGRYEVRAKGRHGTSNPRAFVVTRLAHQVMSPASHDAKAPTPLPLGVVLHSQATAANVDYFKVKVDEGQSIQIDLLAQQVDSRMIGQLKLYAPSGQLLTASRGADDFDPSLRQQHLSAGDYLLAVHDFTFRGGNEFHYQVLARPSAEPDSLISKVGHDSRLGEQLPRTWAVRAFALLAHEALTATDEASPSQSIEVPAESTHWFPANRADSGFEFSADEGETLAIDIVSQRLGEPTDARLIVERIEPQHSGPPKLHSVLNIDDGPALSDGVLNLFAKDPVGLFKAPARANYRVTVRDLDQGQTLSPKQQFKLRIGKPNPGFDLIAYRVYPHTDKNQSKPFASKLFRGGTELIRILAMRRDGWTGAIKIVAQNLPPGIAATEAFIAANQNQTQLTLVASEDAGEVATPIQLVGRSEDDKLTQAVVPAAITWGKGGGRDFIRSRIVSSLYVSVSERDLAPLSIQLGEASLAEVKQGASLSLPIKLTRRDGGKAACVVRPRDLPPGVTVGEVQIAADKSEANWEIKTTPKVAPGTYSLWAQVETKIKIKPNPQALERAQQYRAHLQTLHDDPAQAAQLESIKTAIAAADKQVEAAKAAAQEQELTVFIPTPNVTLRVVQP